MAMKRAFVVVCLVSVSASSFAGLGVLIAAHDNLPTQVVADPLNAHLLYSVGRYGKIRTLKDFVYLPLDESFAVFPAGTIAVGGERAMCSIAFSPTYAEDGYVYTYFARASDGAAVVQRYSRSLTDPTKLDLSTASLVLSAPAGIFHFGGGVTFGPDGYLWVFMGDGDDVTSSQDTSRLNGKILRIDPTVDDFPLDPERNYGIPSDNPFVDGSPIAEPQEAVHIGVRNPWRFRFDSPNVGGTGALLFGDVGADTWEEINYVEPGSLGRNFAWPNQEGLFDWATHIHLAFGPASPPIMTFPHPFVRAIVGGPVYRGFDLGPEMYGRYFFADVVSQHVFSCRLTVDEFSLAPTMSDLLDHTSELVASGGALGPIWSLDTDASGEIIIVGATKLSRIVREPYVSASQIVLSLGFSDLSSSDARPKVVSVRIDQPDFTTKFQIAPNASGEILVPLATGPQTITVKAGTWLREEFSVDTNETYPRKIERALVNGDANQDDSVDAADYAALSQTIGAMLGDPDYDRYVDFDGSGEIDLSDYAILSANYGSFR